jgi:hypothetical protein
MHRFQTGQGPLRTVKVRYVRQMAFLFVVIATLSVAV